MFFWFSKRTFSGISARTRSIRASSRFFLRPEWLLRSSDMLLRFCTVPNCYNFFIHCSYIDLQGARSVSNSRKNSVCIFVLSSLLRGSGRQAKIFVCCPGSCHLSYLKLLPCYGPFCLKARLIAQCHRL